MKMWERREERKRRGLIGGGGGVSCGAGVWCVVLCCVVVVCVCKLRNKFLSRVCTQPVLFLFVHPCKSWLRKNWHITSLVTTVACTSLALLVTMHLALCFQMPGMMVGMDQMDGKIWHCTFYNEFRVASEEYPVLPKSA